MHAKMVVAQLYMMLQSVLQVSISEHLEAMLPVSMLAEILVGRAVTPR